MCTHYADCMSKKRLSASVDEELLAAATAAVSGGRAESVSAWINEALRRQVEHDRRLRALDELISAYEAEHGVITEDEMRQAQRRARERAVVVRGRGASRRSGRGAKRSA